MATERVLPAVAFPAPARLRSPHDAPGGPGPIARPSRPAVQRKEALLNTPTRAGMLIGASAAIYAVTLAGVATLQARDDAALAAQRAPYLEAVSAARAANDSLEAALQRADAQARALASDYASLGQDIGAYEARLDELASLVARVQGSAAALPSRISLPTVSARVAIGSSGSSGGGTKAPATSAKSGASGAP